MPDFLFAFSIKQTSVVFADHHNLVCLFSVDKRVRLSCPAFIKSLLAKRYANCLDGLEGKDSLKIGGSAETDASGWPNFLFSPVLQVSNENDPAKARVHISGGYGFVLDERTNRHLNGDLLLPGGHASVGAFRLVLFQSGWIIKKNHLEVWDSTANRIGDFIFSAGRSRVVPLLNLLQEDIYILRSSNRGAVAASLESNFAGVRLLLKRDGSILILHPLAEYSHAISIPSQLSVIWSDNVKLPFLITQRGNLIRLSFLPPWRLSSPVPPKEAGSRILTLLRKPAPGLNVYLLPAGSALPEPAATLVLQDDPTPVFSNDPNRKRQNLPDILMFSQHKQKDAGNITSIVHVAAGNYTFELSTVLDLPRIEWIFLNLLISLVCFVAAVFGFRSNTRFNGRICRNVSCPRRGVFSLSSYRCLRPSSRSFGNITRS